MDKNYIFRNANSDGDAESLKRHFDGIFLPERVGDLAVTFFRNLPGMEYDNWLIMDDTISGGIVSACAFIPGEWEFEGVRISVGEMGLVGTSPDHRNRGLMNELAGRFAHELERRDCDLGAIQGNPGLYGRYGYHYAIPLENHINLPLNAVEGLSYGGYSIRKAEVSDIPFLMEQDVVYRSNYSLAGVRDISSWNYIFGHGTESDYGRDIRIIEHEGNPLCSFSMMQFGFGTGLIVCEVNERIPFDALSAMLVFLGEEALRREKPYIRFNLHQESAPAEMLKTLGATIKPGWAWQVKIVHPERILMKIAPVINRRLADSPWRESSLEFGVNLYRDSYRMVLEKGILASVDPRSAECEHSISVSSDLFPSLALGMRSWRELNYIRPEVVPSTDTAALLTDVIFPRTRSWIHLRY